jgi:hypothetical protein
MTPEKKLTNAGRTLSAARKRHNGGHNGGRPRTCECGECKTCQGRERCARWRRAKALAALVELRKSRRKKK